MPTPLIMPKFDMDQETATVVEWLKEEGEAVRMDEDVLVVETDKVTIEVSSPASGTLARITARPGDVVPVTAVIAYILAEGETEAELPEEETTAGLGWPAAGDRPQTAGDRPQMAGLIRSIPAAAPTPLAARMARKLGIDLAQVPVEGDRITKADIEHYLASLEIGSFAVGGQPSAVGSRRVFVAATPAARRLAQERGIRLEAVPGSGPRGRVQATDVDAFVVEGPATTDRPAERVPLAGIRRTSAERMAASFQTAPHIALTVDIDVSQLEAARARLNMTAGETAAGEGSQGVPAAKISLTAMLVKAVAWALVRHPYVNSSLLNDQIYLWQEVNVGVATAVEGGLVVPVIHGADRLPIAEIGRRLADLATRARAGRLTLADVRGGTFTLSNLGMYGVDRFQAIINPPESAILAAGRVVRRPLVIDEADTVEVRPVMSLTLSADHRLIDGVTGANFLAELVHAIESPVSIAP